MSVVNESSTDLVVTPADSEAITVVPQVSTQLQTIAKYVYETIKKLYKNISDTKGDLATITDLIAKIAVQVEYFRIGSRSLTSAEKETVALTAGRMFLVDLRGESSPIVTLYDLNAQSILTTSIELSKQINTAVKGCWAKLCKK